MKAEHKILEKGRPGDSLSAISKEEGLLSLQNSETCMMNYLSSTIFVVIALLEWWVLWLINKKKNHNGKAVLICCIINSELF